MIRFNFNLQQYDLVNESPVKFLQSNFVIAMCKLCMYVCGNPINSSQHGYEWIPPLLITLGSLYHSQIQKLWYTTIKRARLLVGGNNEIRYVTEAVALIQRRWLLTLPLSYLPIMRISICYFNGTAPNGLLQLNFPVGVPFLMTQSC